MILRVAKFRAGDQVDGDMMFEQRDVPAFARLRYQGILDRPAGGIRGVQDPAR